jgi:predicted YcjX-like family ATPase
MANPKLKPEPPLYERDFYAWTQEQAEKLRSRAHNEVDWENVAEEIESVGRSQRSEIRKRLGVLIQHLLKWEFQPERRGESWLSTITEQRLHIAGEIQDSPSLRHFPEEALDWSYRWAVRHAAREMRVDPGSLPKEPPYSAAEALDEDFLPGPPWTPGEIALD